MPAPEANSTLTGIGVGDQIAWGKAFLLEPKPQPVPTAKSSLGAAVERQRLIAAIKEVADELRTLATDTDVVNAEILIALAVLIEDQALIDSAEEYLTAGYDAQTAVQKAMTGFSELLAGDAVFAERIADLQDLAFRIALRLAGIAWSPRVPSVGPIIVVADDLSPAETAQFTSAVVGVVTKFGGPTSHTAIVCRQRGIPAIVGVGQLIDQISLGQDLLIDAAESLIVLNADQPQQHIVRTDLSDSQSQIQSEPIIEVLGNAGSTADAEALNQTRASGIGLFRTELLFLNRPVAPSLEEQAALYSRVLESAPGSKVIFRTLDVDSDKALPFISGRHSDLRGWRLHKAAPQILQTQLAAISLAAKSTGKNAAVMAPMISTAHDAGEFAELAKLNGIGDVGVMVETPELASNIEQLAGLVDFVSIGTNDLSRYLFGVDRLASESAELLDGWQPKLLQAIKEITLSAKAISLRVSVCGEAAADPLFAVVLAGLGVDSVSMAGPAIARVAAQLSEISKEKAREVALAALAAADRKAARQLASAKLEQ